MMEPNTQTLQVPTVHQCTEDISAVVYQLITQADCSHEMVAARAADDEGMESRYTVKIEVILTVVDVHRSVVDYLARGKKSKTRRTAPQLYLTRGGVDTLQRTGSTIFDMAIGLTDGHVGSKERGRFPGAPS